MDLEGYAYKVALFFFMFLDDMWLPFCHPVCDVLEMAGVAQT